MFLKIIHMNLLHQLDPLFIAKKVQLPRLVESLQYFFNIRKNFYVIKFI